MIAAPLSPPRVVVYEGSGSVPLDPPVRTSLFAMLLDRGYAVTRAGGGAAGMRHGETIVVLGRFGGAPPAVDAAAGCEVAVRDITGVTAADAVRIVEETRGERRMNRPDETGAGTWKPWFPVIDPARCTNCMQCLSFCLFDVYGVSADNQIRVENPANCKVNCPACSRVCPDVAIMFPKYHAGPIDGGPVSEADVGREKMKVDISALLGGDIYARLRERSAEAKTRFSRERTVDQALAERRRCLTKLADAAAIPREVLDALPTPEEIGRRAEEAAARAKQALAAAVAAGTAVEPPTR
jgi:NAD-dependent dihydropyrimidine dehydrogenase PreA subunit